jgi:hypothetical protein
MDLPPDDALRALLARFAHLLAAHGEAFADAELLEPSGKHFPDEFSLDAPSVVRLLRRMIGYAPLDDELPVEVEFVEPDGAAGGGCGSGACGTGSRSAKVEDDGIVDLGNRYRVKVDVATVGHPDMLTASLARSVGALVLAEAEERAPSRLAGALAELAAVASGFGLLLLNGAAVYAKSCGGVRMHRATHLSVEELGVLVALFLKARGLKPSLARPHLETTQREALDEALRWADSNERLMTTLRERPALLEDGVFEIEPVRGLLGRVMARRRTASEADPMTAPVSRRPQRTEAEKRRLAETQALVDEALAETE